MAAAGGLIEFWRDVVRARCVRRDHALVRTERTVFYEYPSRHTDLIPTATADEVVYEVRRCRCGVAHNTREVERAALTSVRLSEADWRRLKRLRRIPVE